MNLIALSIHRPVAVLSVVLMVVIFGWVALTRIPIQMAPDVRRPVVTVRTNFPGAAPQEVEREILIRQEDVLRTVEGLQTMNATARYGNGSISLEFSPGMNIDRAMALISSQLDRVTGYPADAERPRLITFSNEDEPIASFIITRLPGNTVPMLNFGEFLTEVVGDRIERVPGVSGIDIFGDTARELEVIVDPVRLSSYGITVDDVMSKIRTENASVAGGNLSEGKRRYGIRTQGAISSPEDVRAIVLRSDQGRGRVTIGDVADIGVRFRDMRTVIRAMGESAMRLDVLREQGANVLQVMRGVNAAVEELRTGPLKDAKLDMRAFYDETVYIEQAIDLVIRTIWEGGALAAIILLLFLRSFRATIVIAAAIPVSIIGTFVALAAFGRSLNVLSLAGIAFSVGVVVDSAIVVLENIYRLREQGMSRVEATYRGTVQVWGAILTAALTHVCVFVPILLMDLEVGQLFRDIAVAITVSTLLSLLVAITMLPALANRVLDHDAAAAHKFRIPIVDDFARYFVSFWQGYSWLVSRRKTVALASVAVIVGGTGFYTWSALPKLDYLPTGTRNYVTGFLSLPSGYNLETVAVLAQGIEDKMKKYWVDDKAPIPDPATADPTQPENVRLTRFVMVARDGFASWSGVAQTREQLPGMIKLLSNQVVVEPGATSSAFLPSLFGRGVGGGRAISIDVSGPDIETIFAMGAIVQQRVQQVLPPSEGHQVRAFPGLTFSSPELRVLPDRVRLADNGLTARDLGLAIDVFNDGARVAEISVDGKRMELILRGPHSETTKTQDIAGLPVVTRKGEILPVSSLADVIVTAGPTEIRRLEGSRAISIRVSPAETMPLQTAMDVIQRDVIDALKADGVPPGVTFAMSGTADRLTQTWNAMVANLIIAALITYLVMAVLYESFLYPFIIMLSVPLATAGGVAGLQMLNIFSKTPQALDMLTLLGFVILIGTVCNNAILLVHQTLHLVREEGVAVEAAIRQATENRVRPIFMSTMTSIFGMVPLVVSSGAGTELYRGLGVVVIGGLSLSAVLTLAIIPPMMSIAVGLRERRVGLRAGPASKVSRLAPREAAE